MGPFVKTECVGFQSLFDEKGGRWGTDSSWTRDGGVFFVLLWATGLQDSLTLGRGPRGIYTALAALLSLVLVKL